MWRFLEIVRAFCGPLPTYYFERRKGARGQKLKIDILRSHTPTSRCRIDISGHMWILWKSQKDQRVPITGAVFEKPKLGSTPSTLALNFLRPNKGTYYVGIM